MANYFLNKNEKTGLVPTVGVFTLGCKVNQYESRAIEEEFLRRGFSVMPCGQVCDVYVINTCSVTAEADRKARQFIRRAIKNNPLAKIVVCGCYSQRAPDAVLAIPGVDRVIGNENKLSCVDIAEELLSAETAPEPFANVTDIQTAPFEPMKVTGFERTRAYIKIEDGCESKCAYCVIPSVRGKIRSKGIEDILKEAYELASVGFREIVLTGIEIDSWGKDLGDYRLCDLLERIDTIDGIERIRLGSLDPSFMTPQNIERLASLKHLTPHFHMSIQSGCDKTLAAMRRKYNTQMLKSRMDNIRAQIPNVTFTTDIMTGFPGESDADFDNTCAFVQNADFLDAHIFTYSRRPGTEADKMSGHIPEQIKAERATRLEKICSEISAKVRESFLGQRMPVLVEKFENGMSVGHTPNYIEVCFESFDDLRGQTVTVELSALSDTNLIKAKF